MREDGLKCRKIRGNAPKVCVCRMGGMVDRDMEGKDSWLHCLIFPGTPGTLLAGKDVKTGRMGLHRNKMKVCIVHTYSQTPLSRTKTGEAQIRGHDVRDLWVVARGK